MDVEQTQAEKDRQFELLLANSSPEEQLQLLAARKDHTLRDAVKRLGEPNAEEGYSQFRSFHANDLSFGGGLR